MSPLTECVVWFLYALYVGAWWRSAPSNQEWVECFKVVKDAAKWWIRAL